MVIAGATPGGFGTIMVQNALLPVLRHLGAQVYPAEMLMLTHAGDLIRDHELTDDAARQRLAGFLPGFVTCLRG